MDDRALFRPEYGYDVFLHNGLAYTSDATPELIRNIESFPVGEDDLIVVGFPKSGTNWMNIVLANLYDHWESTKRTPGNVVPEFSVPSDPKIGFQGYEACIASPSPRLMKTHLPYAHMPRAFREGRGKVVFIVRNPKDACDSFYNNLRPYMREGWGWNEHAESFLRGTIYFGPWLDSVLSWYDQLDNTRVLHLTYEGVQLDKRGTLERIVDFVGPVKPGQIEKVLGAMDFEAMKKAGLDKQYQPNMTRREGKIGGWKTRFTVDQSERFDEHLDKPLRARGIHLIYEAQSHGS